LIISEYFLFLSLFVWCWMGVNGVGRRGKERWLVVDGRKGMDG
jgi:hypothetical protein